MEHLTRDVLPSGVRRRLSRRDGVLPAVLMCELFAGMALGVVWPALTTAPPPVPQGAMTAVTVPTGHAPAVPSAVTPAVPPAAPPAVPLPAAPAAVVAVTQPLPSPRNPFGLPSGVDAGQQRPAEPVVPVVPVPAAPVPVAPAVPVPVVPGPAAVPLAPVPGAVPPPVPGAVPPPVPGDSAPLPGGPPPPPPPPPVPVLPPPLS